MGNATPAAVLSLEDQPDILEAAPSDHTFAEEHGALVSQPDSTVAQVTPFGSCECFMVCAHQLVGHSAYVAQASLS